MWLNYGSDFLWRHWGQKWPRLKRKLIFINNFHTYSNYITTLWKGYLRNVQHFKIQREGTGYCICGHCGIFTHSSKGGTELEPKTLQERLQHSGNPKSEPVWWSQYIITPFICMRGVPFVTHSVTLSVLHRPSVSPVELAWFNAASVKCSEICSCKHHEL